MNSPPAPAHDRRALLSRLAAAVIGGYLLASVGTIFLSFILPSSLPEAVLAASLASFAIYTAAIVWVFAARNPTRAWLGLLLPGVGLAAAAFVLHLADAAP
jgi:hypothetical protein